MSGWSGRLRGDLSPRASAFLLFGLVAVSALARGLVARGVRSPWIFPDELIYSSLGKSVASSAGLAIRGVHTTAYSVVYPLLLSLPFAGRDPAAGYAAAKWTDAVVMSLAAVPVFLLARRLLPRWLSLIAAAFALLIPSMAYTGVLMTENAFYPLFLLALLAIVRTIERPTVRRQLATLLAIGLAYLTRAQGIVLVPVLLLAVALFVLSGPSRNGRWSAARRELGRFLPTVFVLAAAVLAVLGEELARGESAAAFLGTYSTTVQSYPLAKVPRWVASQLAELELYLGFLPFVPAIIVASALLRRKSTDGPRRAVAAVAVAAVVCVLLLVAVFSAGPGEQASSTSTYPKLGTMLHERYLFYLAPLYLVFFLYWLYRRRDFSGRILGALIVVAVVLPLSLPYARVRTNADFEALALLPWNNNLIAPRHVPLALAVTAAILLPLLFVRRGTIVLLQVGLVVVILWFVGSVATHEIRSASLQLPSSRVAAPSWIDRAVPRGERVAALWIRSPGWSTATALGHEHDLWRAEFFNASVGPFLYAGTPMHYGLPETAARLSDGRLILQSRAAAGIRYLLVASPVALDGRVVARDRKAGLRLYRLRRPLEPASS